MSSVNTKNVNVPKLASWHKAQVKTWWMNFARIITSRIRRQNSPIDVQTGQKYWILGVGHVGKDDSLRCWNVHVIFSDHMLTNLAPVWRMSAPVWGRILTGEFYSGHWLGVPLHTGSPYTDCTVTTITVHLYCTLVTTAYKLPALTTKCRSYSLSVWTLSYTQYVLILDPVHVQGVSKQGYFGAEKMFVFLKPPLKNQSQRDRFSRGGLKGNDKKKYTLEVKTVTARKSDGLV